MMMWDYLEEGTAVLDDAAEASQFLEGDKYPYIVLCGSNDLKADGHLRCQP